MTTPVTVRTGIRGAVSINPQTLLVVVFLALLLYLLFTGSSNDGNTKGGGHVEQDEGHLYGVDAPLPSSAETLAAPITPSSSPPTPSSTATMPAPLSPVTPLREEEVLYDPTALRKLDPNAPHTPILRRSNLPTSGRHKSVSFNSSDPEGQETVKTHPDGLMRGEGRADQDWNHPDDWNSKPEKRAEREAHRDISLDLKALKCDQLFDGIRLPPHIHGRLLELDAAADQECRGRSANVAIDTDGDRDDPLKDRWDTVWGIMPALGIDGAQLVAAGIKEAHINDIAEHMVERAKIALRDKQRSFEQFIARTAPDDGGRLTPDRLAIGWFGDTYRNIDPEVRMSIDNTFVNFEAKWPTVSRLLQWLEGFARRLWRQRLLSTGVDFDGCALRLAMPSRLQAPEDESEGLNYRYELQLHVFLWGGPVADGDKNLLDDWMARFCNGCDGMRTTMKEIHNMMSDLGEPLDVLDSKVDARRVFFRPGFTTFGINSGQQLDKVQQGLADINAVSRDAVAVILPPDIWSAFPSDRRVFSVHRFDHTLSATIDWIKPQIANCCNLRQHQWSKDTMTTENSKLSEAQLLAALRAASTTMNYSSKGILPNRHTVQTLDLGSFVPLVSTGGTNIRFFPLDDFRSLRKIVMPHLASTKNHPSTAELLISAQFGLDHYLRSRQRAPDEVGPPSRLIIEITCADADVVESFTKRMIALAWPAAREIINNHLHANAADADGINRARKLGREAITGWLKGVFTRDLSSTGRPASRIGRTMAVHADEITFPEEFLAVTRPY